jgi:hypothetical protein
VIEGVGTGLGGLPWPPTLTLSPPDLHGVIRCGNVCVEFIESYMRWFVSGGDPTPPARRFVAQDSSALSRMLGDIANAFGIGNVDGAWQSVEDG